MSSFLDKPFTIDRLARIFLTLVLFAAGVSLVILLRNALLPFLVAWLMAYMAQPIVKFFQYKLKIRSRILSIVALFVFFALVAALISLLVVPSVSMEIDKTVELVRQYNSQPNVEYIPQAWIEFLKENIDTNAIMSYLSIDNAQKVLKEVVPRVWGMVSGTFSVLLSITIVFLVFLYFVFILLDYERIADGWVRLIPEKYRPFVLDLFGDVERNMNCYFRGQALVALCVGILLAIGFQLIGYPLAVLLGLFIGMLNLIPYLQTLGLLPMVLLALLQSAETGENFWMCFGLGLVVLGTVQAIQDLFLVPKIMGKAMGMNPAIILLSLSIWGTLLGFVGLIIALPLTTLCVSYYKKYVIND